MGWCAHNHSSTAPLHRRTRTLCYGYRYATLFAATAPPFPFPGAADSPALTRRIRFRHIDVV
jgi:hypothetical protein